MTKKSLHFIIAIFVIISAFACSNKQVHRKQLSDKSFQNLQMDSVFAFTESDEVAFQHISSMKTDGHGHIIVHDFRQPFLFMFDHEGNVLQKIGRKGKGPGEFEQINLDYSPRNLLVDKAKLE